MKGILFSLREDRFSGKTPTETHNKLISMEPHYELASNVQILVNFFLDSIFLTQKNWYNLETTQNWYILLIHLSGTIRFFFRNVRNAFSCFLIKILSTAIIIENKFQY